MHLELNSPHVGITRAHTSGKHNTQKHVYTIQFICKKKMPAMAKIEHIKKKYSEIEVAAKVDVAFGKINKADLEGEYRDINDIPGLEIEGFRSNFKKYYIYSFPVEVDEDANNNLKPIFVSKTEQGVEDLIHNGIVHLPGGGDD